MVRSIGAHFIRVDRYTFLKYATLSLDKDGVVLRIDQSADNRFREQANTEFYSGIIAAVDDKNIEVGTVVKLKIVDSIDIDNYSGYGNIFI